MSHVRRLAIASLICLFSLFSSPGASAQSGVVSVVHGIPEVTVDVRVDGARALEDAILARGRDSDRIGERHGRRERVDRRATRRGRRPDDLGLSERHERDVSYGDDLGVDLFQTTYRLSLQAAGTRTTVFGPADVPVERGVGTIVYAIGSLADDSFDFLVQTLPLSRN